MFKKNDPNSFSVYYKLKDSENNILGYLAADYKVNNYKDVQIQDVQSVNKSKTRQFLLQCTQRIVISNNLSINPTDATEDKISYDNYPALIKTFIDANNTDNKGVTLQVLDYSPKTVNTKVQQSGSTGDSAGKTNGSSKSSTVGSSTSETNSYGTSVTTGMSASLGFMGDILNGGVSSNESTTTNQEHSNTTTHDHSNTTGSDSSSSRNHDVSNSNSMSVKDWGIYGVVNPNYEQPNWIFAQEYPWDSIESRMVNKNINTNNKNQKQLIIPTEISARLYDGVSLLPPSQLSLFGVNFVMMSTWLVTLDNSACDEIEFIHNIFYSTASHSLSNDKTVSIYIDEQPIQLQGVENTDLTTIINLPLMALDVLGIHNKPAIIGFIPSKFTVLPTSNRFKIVSSSNTLLIEDSTNYGNAYPSQSLFTTSETALTAKFSESQKSLTMSIYFKVVDDFNDYRLYMKHWKTGKTAFKLTFTFNNNTNNAVIKFVDALEAEGGENNLLSIVLRNQNFASVDYHDYLQLGLNSIQITIEPVDLTTIADCGYQVRAISIENE